MRSLPLNMHHKPIFKFSLLSMMLLQAQYAFANETAAPAAVMPTIKIEAMSELDPVKSYIDYDQASVTRNGLKKKDIPQTIDTIDVQKYKIYGANDLSVMLQGTPGVTTTYDTRGDGIMIRGFSADTSDIYRNGVREGGQVRRSTANVERIEILKGPASVLYGRGAGGGVVNMVTKFANFDSKSSVGVYGGSYENIGGTLDINQVVNDNWAVRLVGEKSDTNSFRSGIGTKQSMFSPSVTYRSDDEKLLWTTEYTYDKLDRVPDRGPSFSVLSRFPENILRETGFATSSDFIIDELQTVRTDLKYEFAPDWKFHWALSYRQANQDFDNFFGGSYCTDSTKGCKPGYIKQSYAWQETMNKTTTNTFDITGKFNTGKLEHQLMVGADWSHEDREPKLGNYSSGDKAGLYYQLINPYNPRDYQSSFDRVNGRPIETSYTHQNNDSLAFFVQDLISLTPTLKMMLGARYDQYEVSTRDTSTISQTYGATVKIDAETFSPNIGFVWQPIDSQSLYTSYSKSFAPFGGSAGLSPFTSGTVDLETFNAEPQYNEQYEIGIKSDWLDDRLSTQFSVFDIRKKNIRYRPNPDDEPSLYVVGGEHQSKGAEFSFIGRMMDNLFVRGGYGYTDADVKQDKVRPENVGHYLANTAKNTGNLFIRYLPLDNIYTEIGATYNGSFYTNISNNPDTKIDGWTRFDAAVGYKGEHWGATLAVSNLTDKVYWRSNTMPGTPRNFLVRLNYQF
ncbi:ligand-gated channel protein [Acinetobacter gyllenbergii]|uniref:Iron complex outermembrane recepter protein n=1 Tax=Acinetobacter gyllenbergii CIP 110306 = MTCC 11365 TaxID=1217657 RepID=A0A829HHL7_9GAMM|nr:TonB-dependent receptor [Acinetobacter gyllenbergii]EPF87773.1 iron complex outermembrane recepter protein [Acinetobacter gyllenbergii CIP 110306 = MTCC 11365]EPH34483.1 Ferrichrome-iron receptor [Acinetobacter gyllenbergii CIP 110306 = MTCC 11365]ESK50679.1 hypothetical protein F987_01499 [Acinetobacter gyllenbergii NIPH 230]GMA11720.1 ligand-gated channel protein [Acinetobacter gyllenbergii]